MKNEVHIQKSTNVILPMSALYDILVRGPGAGDGHVYTQMMRYLKPKNLGRLGRVSKEVRHDAQLMLRDVLAKGHVINPELTSAVVRVILHISFVKRGWRGAGVPTSVPYDTLTLGDATYKRALEGGWSLIPNSKGRSATLSMPIGMIDTSMHDTVDFSDPSKYMKSRPQAVQELRELVVGISESTVWNSPTWSLDRKVKAFMRRDFVKLEFMKWIKLSFHIVEHSLIIRTGGTRNVNLYLGIYIGQLSNDNHEYSLEFSPDATKIASFSCTSDRQSPQIDIDDIIRLIKMLQPEPEFPPGFYYTRLPPDGMLDLIEKVIDERALGPNEPYRKRRYTDVGDAASSSKYARASASSRRLR